MFVCIVNTVFACIVNPVFACIVNTNPEENNRDLWWSPFTLLSLSPSGLHMTRTLRCRGLACLALVIVSAVYAITVPFCMLQLRLF